MGARRGGLSESIAQQRVRTLTSWGCQSTGRPFPFMVSLTASSSNINQTRFEELWSESFSPIRRYVLSLKPECGTVDDILQETSIALWLKFDAYDPTRPFVAWACRFAFLQVLKQRQRCRRDCLVFDNHCYLNARSADFDGDPELLGARLEALAKSLKSLDHSDRKLLERRYHSKETVQRMAKQESTSVYKLYHSLDSIRDTLKLAINQTMINGGWDRSELV